MKWSPVCLVVASSLAGCAAPQPRAPESIVAQVDKSPRPSVLERLELTAQQDEKIDELLHELYAAFAEYDRTRIVLLEEVVREIRNDTLSRVTLEPLAKTSIAAFEEAYPQLQSALNELHAILSQEQRKTLIDMLSGKQEEQQSDEERRAEREERLGRILDLTASQKTQLYPALAVVGLKHYGMISHFRSGIKEAKEAFLSDSFDATQLSLANDLRLLETAEAIYEALDASIKILTPEQRETLAALLDSHLR